MSRPRKANVRRDRNGKWRGFAIHPESIAARERELEHDGIILSFFKRDEYGRKILRRTAEDGLAGSTLGRLWLRHRQGDHACGISQDQFDAGQSWAVLVRRHGLLMTEQKPIHAATLEIGGGRSLTEPLEETVLYIRRKWCDCYDSLMQVCDTYGLGIRDITYGICVENWPMERLYNDYGFGKLRVGLNSLVRALDLDRKSVQVAKLSE